jgi:hypothetical protein
MANYKIGDRVEFVWHGVRDVGTVIDCHINPDSWVVRWDSDSRERHLYSMNPQHFCLATSKP